MHSTHWIAALLLTSLPLAGCDKPQSTPAGGTATTTTRTDPATMPATTQAAISTLTIDNKSFTFPRARLVVQQIQPNVALVLFTDDPKEAIKSDYRGNRYYFELKLAIDDINHLPATVWNYKSASIERADSPIGIFLDGDRQQLQPHEVNIAFSGSGSTITLDLRGQFLLFASRDEGTPPKSVLVHGLLTAELHGREGLTKKR